jgi:hypothetical protein
VEQIYNLLVISTSAVFVCLGTPKQIQQPRTF